MKAYFTLLRQVLPYRQYVLWFSIFSILAVLFSLVSLVLLVPFLELLFDKTPLVTAAPDPAWSKDYLIQKFYYTLSSKILADGKTAALSFFCVVVTCVFFAKNLFRYLALYALAPLRNRLILDLRDKMYRHVQSLPITYFQRQNKGDLITRFTSDLTEIEYSIMNTLETSIQSPLTIILFLGAMLTMSVKLTLFVFGMILVMALVIGRIGKSLKKESQYGKEVLGRLTSIIDETISGIKIIQAFSIQDWVYKQFQSENKSYFDTYNAMYRKRDLSSPLTEFLAIIVVCIVLWYGGNLVLASHGLTAPVFISFMVVFSQLIPPAKSFSGAIYEIKKGMASYDRLQAVLKEETIDENQEGIELKELNKDICFESITHRFGGSEVDAVHDFTYTFQKGKKYAIVGSSGAGKSTIMDILLGFLTPTAGHIRMDEKAIEVIKRGSYLKLFGYVTQEPFLFNQSIRSNICLGPCDETKYQQALKISNTTDLAARMQEDAIGERGSKLSGGERQRLTIARVAYRDPAIVLMDEATSALDSQNEHEVQQAMDQLMLDRTSIVIAHRLSTVKNADCILLMHEGRILASGNHTELYQNNTVYKQMVDLQRLT